MQVTRRAAFLGAMAFAIAGCGRRIRVYRGPVVTKIAVFKKDRRMYLFHQDTVLKGYDIDLGFEPVGDKRYEGDGRTPEGHYVIDRRNPRSQFHLSIGISYPDPRDIAEAKKLGRDPGGDIFIHGQGNIFSRLGADWTWGCIAVTNEEMEEIYTMVADGTPISIYP